MSKPVYTPEQIVEQLTRDGYSWADHTVTFGFPAKNGVDATQQEFIVEAMSLWDDVTNIDLVYSGGESGDIVFANNVGQGTKTTFSYDANKHLISAAITFDQNWWSNQSENLAYGSYGFESMLHEIGHALGLSHPGDYDGTADYDDDAVFQQDTQRYTVMSYFTAEQDGSGTTWWFYNESSGQWEWHYPETPMIYDILAVESCYGRETDTRTDDTTYGYHSTADSDVFDFEQNAGPVLTIFDSGGNDTLDLSGDTVDDYFYPDDYERVIDLNDGAYSSTHGMTNNIGIAFGTIIENAIGTQFADHIIGNEYANTIEGRRGADQVEGGEARDIVFGGLGRDSSSGDADNDVVFVHFGANTVSFDDGDGVDSVFGYKPGVDEFDLTHVEGLSSFDDLTLTNFGADVLVDYGDGSFVLMNTSLRSVDEADFAL